ncbi:hypothetical protein GCM10022224_001340 [Nonomuraea antimicrobica]|uniref:DUF4365 domain-containing protein n=2 Tax=Nonomuraea antimicrobica TaxID=561173 RepID=A0ABP7AX91_9ACTN
MFNDRPKLAVEILRNQMGVDLPDNLEVRRESNTFNTRPSDDIDADVVLSMGPRQEPVHAIIVEVQQDKSKDAKQFARYAAALWLLLRCDVITLLVCPDQGTATHYANPIDTGLTGYRPEPYVLGPDDIPAITDPDEAATHLALSAMSVMAHGRNRQVIEAFAAALVKADDEHAAKYHEYAYSMAAADIRRLMEEIMKSTDWPVHSPLAREHFGRGLDQGKAEGKAEEAGKMLLLVLGARGLDVPEDAHARITACTDLAQLEAWTTLAVTAKTIHDVFD